MEIIYWNFDEIPPSEFKKAKVATINKNAPALKEIAEEFNVIPTNLCAACGTNMNKLILEWFTWANHEKKFDQ